MLQPLNHWDDIIDEFNGGAILLGNGFSIGCSESFKYCSLYDVAKDHKFLTIESQSLFEKWQTTNFEYVLKKLITANDVIQTLSNDNSSIKMLNLIQLQYESIKNSLIQSIDYIHPNYKDVAVHLPSIVHFLEPFKNIFTLNYDMLIYWAYANVDCMPKDSFYKKGSGYVEFDILDYKPRNKNDTYVYYLHGAIFIYTKNNNTRKIINNGFNIIEQVKLNLQDNLFPLFVSEGNSDKKTETILGNHYLSSCYQALLESISSIGNIVIFGHSLSDFDNHIYEAITRAEPHKIAIGIYASDDLTVNKIQIRAHEIFNPINLVFYDSKTVPLWQETKIK